jgi:hypothetical protein
MKSRLFTLIAGCAVGMAQLSFGQTPVYSGESAVAKVNVLGVLNASIEDTGQLPPGGGSLSTELVALNVPSLLDLHLLSASTSGQNNETDSAASVTQISLTAAGIHITASVLTSNATATCAGTVTGTSTVVGLKVNGLSVRVTGAPNQTIPLLVGSLVINEQISSVVNTPSSTVADMLVNALHLKVLALADVAISSSHSGVSCSFGVPQ